MKKYYYNCPRGFSNEFSIISVEQTNAQEAKQFSEFYNKYQKSDNTNWDLHQITENVQGRLYRMNVPQKEHTNVLELTFAVTR